MNNALDVSEARGFAIDEFFNTIGVVFVRAGIEAVTQLLKQMTGGHVVSADQAGSGDSELLDETNVHAVIFQFREHNWTLFTYDVCKDHFIKQFAEKINAPCIYFEYEDASVWSSYKLIHKGNVVEEYRFGPDYSDDIDGFFEEVKEDVGEDLTGMMKQSEKQHWDIDIVEDGEQFQFRSVLQTVGDFEIIDMHAFLDKFFKYQDAWFPDWDYFPDPNGRSNSPYIKPDDFIGVNILTAIPEAH